VGRWIDAGRPQQPGPPDWRRETWIASFPEYSHVFERLPDDLTRDAVRAAVAEALAAGSATEGFVAVMAWGYGKKGYGPHRVGGMLGSRPDVGACLAEAAHRATTGRALDAYRALAGPHRIAGLGPAFGTKYLYFASPRDAPALILDKLVSTALERTSPLRLNPVPWKERTYSIYTVTMGIWARHLEIQPDELEQVLFVDQASRNGSQWRAA
jgi:hypothetical protein